LKILLAKLSDRPYYGVTMPNQEQAKDICRGGYLCYCRGYIHAGEIARPVVVQKRQDAAGPGTPKAAPPSGDALCRESPGAPGLFDR